MRVSADPPQIEMSHRFVSFTPTNDGISGAEYDFTIKNRGTTDLYDVRFALGIGAPLPPGPYDQPTLRVPMIGAGATLHTRYTVTVAEPSEDLARHSDLVGWVEAVEGQGGDIVRAGVVSRFEAVQP